MIAHTLSRIGDTLGKWTGCLFCVAFLLSAGQAVAQEFPTRAVHFMVPYSPGTPPDIITRLMAIEMAKTLGQPTIVDNKPGADTVIGYEYVAKQMPADGYTVAITPLSNLALLPSVAKDLRFDPIKDLPPFISLGEGRLVFGVSAATPWKSFQEVIAAVKAGPNKWNYGSASVLLRFPMLVLISDMNLQLTHIPYAQAAPYYRALAVNDVQMGFLSESGAATMPDKFRVLAVTGERNSPVFPDAVPFAKLGYPTLPPNIFAFSLRVGTPKAVIDRLHASATAALRLPDIKTKFAGLQFEVMNDTPKVAEERLLVQAKLFGDVAAKMGIKPQ